jgi:hypothetical protein
LLIFASKLILQQPMGDSSGDEPEAEPLSNVEQMLALIMENQERAETRNSHRFAAMQTAIDAQEAARAAAAAAQPGASIWGAPAAPAEAGWLRRMTTPSAAAPSTVPPAPRPASSAATLSAVAALAGPPAAPPAPPIALVDQLLKGKPSSTTTAAAATSAAALAARARAARAARQPAAPAPIDVDADGDDRDEYFDALDEQYDLLIAAPDSEKSLADNFGGHPLPIQHRARFWPRNDNFQETTCHYHPAIAGDTLNGKLVDKLEALGAQQHATKQPEFGTQYAYECRSLIAAISYLTDASMQQQVTVASILDSLKDAGSMPAGLESLPQDSIDMAVHLKSCVSHLKERVDVLRAASRSAHVEVEILARLYDSEDRIAGDRSDLGAAVEARSLEGATRKMISQSASERVTAAIGVSKLTPRGPPPREHLGGGLSRTARDRARKLQPVGGRQAGAAAVAKPAQAQAAQAQAPKVQFAQPQQQAQPQAQPGRGAGGRGGGGAGRGAGAGGGAAAAAK